MKPSLLLFITFLGAVSGQIPWNNGQRFSRSDPTYEMVFEFMMKISNALGSRDPSVLSELFQPGFIFKGCKGTYNKQQFVFILSQIAPNARYSYEAISEKDNGDSIKFTLLAKGLGPSDIVADFVLNKADQKLESAVIPACQKSHFLGFVSDPVREMVKKFLARMENSIESHDTAIINGLFQPGFTFKGCEGVSNKQRIVAVLSQLPVGTVLTFTLKSVQDNGASIKYTVTGTGFGATGNEADFILNKVDQQLESGAIHACQKSHFVNGMSVQEDSTETIIQKFLARMSTAIMYKKIGPIDRLFQPGFVFQGCNNEYFNKQQAVAFLSQLRIGTQFFFKVKSFSQTESTIKFTVSIQGLGPSEFDVGFVLNISHWRHQLESAYAISPLPKIP